MTAFDFLSLSLALLAVFIAVFIKRPVVMPKIQFNPIAGQTKHLGNYIPSIEDELNHTRLKVFEKEAKKRQKLRHAAKKRNRVKGRFV